MCWVDPAHSNSTVEDADDRTINDLMICIAYSAFPLEFLFLYANNSKAAYNASPH